MNKILLIIIVVVMVIVGVAIAYFANIGPAVQLVKAIQQKISSLTTGIPNIKLDAQTLLTGGGAVATVGSLYSTYSQYKQRLSAEASAAKEALANSDLVNQIDNIKNAKSDLESQLTQLKSETKTELDSYKAEIAKLKQEKANMQSSLNTLNNLVPKIEKQKEIIKMVT